MPKAKKKVTKARTKPRKPQAMKCGLVMPISPIDGLTAQHWSDMKDIVFDAVESIEDFDITISLVSDADDVGVIQRRIVQNLYESDIVVCDVSAKNPNVMFELGMRLAFDKPTVIIKDDKTDYSFDTSVIEHIPYPRDLNYSLIMTFKEALADKVLNTYRMAKADPGHSTFLKSFGKFQASTLPTTSTTSDAAIAEALGDIQNQIAQLRAFQQSTGAKTYHLAGDPGAIRRLTQVVDEIVGHAGRKHLTTYIKDPSFVRAVERKMRISRYFRTRGEFRETLEAVAESMAVTARS